MLYRWLHIFCCLYMDWVSCNWILEITEVVWIWNSCQFKEPVGVYHGVPLAAKVVSLDPADAELKSGTVLSDLDARLQGLVIIVVQAIPPVIFVLHYPLHFIIPLLRISCNYPCYFKSHFKWQNDLLGSCLSSVGTEFIMMNVGILNDLHMHWNG